MTLTQTEPTPLGRIAGGGAHRLLVVYSPARADLGYSRTLNQAPLVIGREPDSTPSLPLRQAQVSRRHARITPSVTGFRIEDLGSRNGTFVNGRNVSSAELADGDVIRIGSTLLLYQFLDAAACELVQGPLLRAHGERSSYARLIGTGHAMARLREAIRNAPTSVPVLVQGETGVGKELVAEALHEQSERVGPFVPVNCSALPSNLIESELFGHVRGAFTGAEARKGLYGRAEKGTLFLDEIGDIAVDVQAKLLRALAINEVRSVGSDQPRTVDVRVVAATNVDLEAAVAAGSFRADLYARLMAHIIVVPPLRERREDILELTRHFLREAGDPAITADVAEALVIYGWPYNVRELEQVLAPIAVIAKRRGKLELSDLPQRLRDGLELRFEQAPVVEAASSPLLCVRRDAVPSADELRTVVEAHNGNIAQVAAFFGKDRRQIYRWAHALSVDMKSLRDEMQRQTVPPPPSSSQPPASSSSPISIVPGMPTLPGTSEN
jgi:transcriptional regulator with GAF, ATPase, and Fis domain